MALAGSLALFGACTPGVTINDIYGNQDAAVTATCQPVTDNAVVDLRPNGNSAGSNVAQLLGGATITLVSLLDQNGTKAAKLELDACGGKASATLEGSQTSALTINGQSVNVTVVSIAYDASGPIVRVQVYQASPVDSGASD